MADSVDGVRRDGSGQEHAPSTHQGFDVLAAVDAGCCDHLGGGQAGGIGRTRHCRSQVERRGRGHPGGDGVGDELHQRRAPSQVLIAVGDQQPNLAGPGQEPVGFGDRREELDELGSGDRDRGFVGRQPDGVVDPEDVT